MAERIIPIKTKYKGILFRSKLEAQWAKFFDAHEIDWQYEVEGYDLGDKIYYLPDFYLPQQDCFFEVKGVMNDFDLEKIEKLHKFTKKDIFIGYGNGSVDEYSVSCGFIKYDNETTFEKCPECARYFFSDTRGFHGCRICNFYSGNDCCETIYCHDNNYRLYQQKTDEYWNRYAMIDVRNEV